MLECAFEDTFEEYDLCFAFEQKRMVHLLDRTLFPRELQRGQAAQAVPQAVPAPAQRDARRGTEGDVGAGGDGGELGV